MKSFSLFALLCQSGRTFAIFVFFVVAQLSTLNSQQSLFQWDRDPFAAGYRLYYGDTTHVYTNSVQIGQTTNQLLTLPPGRYYFSLTATNGLGEGPYSNEVTVSFTNAVKILPVMVITTQIQSAPTLTGSWSTITNYQLQITQEVPSSFIRAHLDLKIK